MALNIAVTVPILVCLDGSSSVFRRPRRFSSLATSSRWLISKNSLKKTDRCRPGCARDGLSGWRRSWTVSASYYLLCMVANWPDTYCACRSWSSQDKLLWFTELDDWQRDCHAFGYHEFKSVGPIFGHAFGSKPRTTNHSILGSGSLASWQAN